MLHYVPEPMLVIGPSSLDRLNRCVKHWLQLRTSWLWMLTGDKLSQLDMTPPRSADWRHYLNAGPESLQAEGLQSKRLGLARYLETVLQGKAISPNSNPAWFNAAIDVENTVQMQQIAWELSEIAFGVELRALDAIMVPPPPESSALEKLQAEATREKLIVRVFGGRHWHLTSIPQRNEGLAASTLAARRPSLGALREVFSRWPHVTSAIESMALTETTSPQDLLRHEQELARFYVQTFWEYAGRAAAVPRRLPGVL